ncbi:type II secretion system protein [Deinococcus detaillensis]|uniref:Type II secretion system protein n=1 Tax=Deinococcus detaillensis TaxID=2592048 RepID=A0A553V0A3_9DEIO|nr:type II secretion system protein [Deinococcus detaillensis]TSA85894.1 type II secretion system protein [Deinococcus detaillensis]
MIYKKKSHQVGFTLIETLITLALIGVVVTAIAVPLIGFNKVNIDSQRTLSATAEAQRQIEAVRTLVTADYDYNPPLTAAQLGGVTCTNLNVLDMPMSPSGCAQLSNPPMRRLSITRNVSGINSPVTLTLDVRP